jgi:hypothetical protein
VGQLHAVAAGKEYTRRDGQAAEPWVVKVLVGDEVVKIEYPSYEAMRKVVTSDTQLGDQVAIRVYLRTQEYQGKALLFFRGAGIQTTPDAA